MTHQTRPLSPFTSNSSRLELPPEMKNPNSIDLSQKFLLHQAVKDNNLPRVKELVRLDFNTIFLWDADGYTPSHYAAMKGHIAMLRYFYEKAPFANSQRTSQVETALHLVARQGQLQSLTYLLKTDPDLLHKTANGKTALDVANEAGQTVAANYLKLVQILYS